MKVFVLQYTDSSAAHPNRFTAHSSRKAAENEYDEIDQSDGDITLLDKKDAITEYNIKKKKDLINLINCLALTT